MFQSLRSLILSLLVALVLLAGVASPSVAQTSLTTTTFASAVTDPAATTVTVSSATGITTSTWLWVDWEAMRVTAVNGTLISVRRGEYGTTPAPHSTTPTVYVAPSLALQTHPPALGSCVRAEQTYLPWIDTQSGTLWTCDDRSTDAFKWYGANVAVIAFDSVIDLGTGL